MANDHNDADEAIGAKVLLGAMLTGAKDGVTESLASKAEETGKKIASLIEPGDQRHVAHPLDQFKSRMLWAAEWIIAPGDMNLKHSPHPVDTTAKIYDALINAAADTLTEKGLVEGVRTTSAVAAAIAVDNTDPFKKLQMVGKINDLAATEETLTKKLIISWNDYAHLLGKGSQPPKLKPLRDFSDLMEYTPPRAGDWSSLLYYKPDDKHKISMRLYHLWGATSSPESMTTAMRFTVRAEINKEIHGTGAEMFHSAIKRLSQEGITIKEIQGSWAKDGALSTNYNVFAEARQQGASVKEAISLTPTGRWASDAGFTEVGGWSFNKAVSSQTLPDSLEPEFTRPKFHTEHQSYSDYGNAWASSQGRTSQDLVHRQKPIESSAKLPTTELSLSGLTKAQADAVRQYMHEHIDKHFDALISGQKINPEMK